MSIELAGVVIMRGAFVLEIDARLDAPCTALLGPSGSGKTTVLECIAGLVRPAHGAVTIHSETASDATSGLFTPPWQRKIGYVPQDTALFPHMTVRANLAYSSRAEAASSALVTEVLEIAPLLDRRPTTLSGGEKRRVALGRALLARPRVLLLDEPLTGLDRALKDRAIDLLLRVRREFATPMILVTHDDREANRLADEVVRLETGHIVGQGPSL